MGLSRHLRDVAMDELTEYMERKADPSCTMILAGDFNIIRYPYTDHYRRKIISMNPGHEAYLDLIESEQAHLLETLQNYGKFTV